MLQKINVRKQYKETDVEYYIYTSINGKAEGSWVFHSVPSRDEIEHYVRNAYYLKDIPEEVTVTVTGYAEPKQRGKDVSDYEWSEQYGAYYERVPYSEWM